MESQPIQGFFTHVQTRQRQVDRATFIAGLEKNQVLYGEILGSVVERIIEAEGDKVFEMINIGTFPDFLREELEEELRMR